MSIYNEFKDRFDEFAFEENEFSGEFTIDKNGWFHALTEIDKKVAEEKAELEKKLRIAEIKNATSLANNLCPDHRDKQQFRPCLACMLENAEKQREGYKEQVSDVKAYVSILKEEKKELVEKLEYLTKALDDASTYHPWEIITVTEVNEIKSIIAKHKE